MRCHHNESHVEQEVRADHTVLGRAVPQHLEHRLQFGRDGRRVNQLGHALGAAERLQCPHTTSNQFIDHARDKAVRQLVGGGAGFHPHRCQQHGVSRYRRGGKSVCPRHCARRSIERVAQAGRLTVLTLGREGRGQQTTRSPLQHDHRQPRFLLEFRIGELVVLAQCCGVDFPEDAAAGVLGQLVEGF